MTNNIDENFKLEVAEEPTIVVPKGRLLLKEVKVENKSSGGIILSQTADTENLARIGEVIYNGITVNGFKSHIYREGCKVHFGKHAGATVLHNDVKYISVTEAEIAAISY